MSKMSYVDWVNNKLAVVEHLRSLSVEVLPDCYVDEVWKAIKPKLRGETCRSDTVLILSHKLLDALELKARGPMHIGSGPMGRLATIYYVHVQKFGLKYSNYCLTMPEELADRVIQKWDGSVKTRVKNKTVVTIPSAVLDEILGVPQ